MPYLYADGCQGFHRKTGRCKLAKAPVMKDREHMKLSQLIAQLEALKAEHGDIPVKVQTLSHRWDPEPVIRPIGVGEGTQKWVLLNP